MLKTDYEMREQILNKIGKNNPNNSNAYSNAMTAYGDDLDMIGKLFGIERENYRSISDREKRRHIRKVAPGVINDIFLDQAESDDLDRIAKQLGISFDPTQPPVDFERVLPYPSPWTEGLELQSKPSCDHSWADYHGLTESFTFCTKCDQKVAK